MTPFNDRLYNLIPAIYRIRDEESNGPLRELLSVVTEQVDVIQRDMDRLYDNWFIETCDEWVVPYIGELVGHTPVIPTSGQITDPHVQARNRWLFPRREIANIVKYRRRKGTLPVLEEIALDTAGWSAFAVEFRKQVAATPDLRFADAESWDTLRLPNFRDAAQIARIGGPFNMVGHTVNFRKESGIGFQPVEARGRQAGSLSHGLPIHPRKVGLWVWRMTVCSYTGVTPGCGEVGKTRYFTFHPLGLKVPLYNLPQLSKDPEALAKECELPVALTWANLRDRHGHPCPNYYAAGRSLVIRINAEKAYCVGICPMVATGGGFVEIPASRIRVGSLADGELASIDGRLTDEVPVCIDPVLGRFVVKSGLAAPMCDKAISCDDFEVTYHTAFGGDLGGGEYRRPPDPRRKMATWIVTPTEPPVRVDARCSAAPQKPDDPAPPKGSTIDQAVRLLVERLKTLTTLGTSATADQRHVVLELAETGVYRLTLVQEIQIPANVTVEIRAAARACPFVVLPDGGACQPLPLRWSLHAGAKLVLDGLVISTEGMCVSQIADPTKPVVRAGCSNEPGEIVLLEPSRVLLRHTTLVPRSPHCCCPSGKGDRASHGQLLIGEGIGEVCLDHAITGPIETCRCVAPQGADCAPCGGDAKHCPPPATRLRVLDSIVDGQGGSVASMGGAEYRAAAAIGLLVASALRGATQPVAAIHLATRAIDMALSVFQPAGLRLEASRSTFLGTLNVQTLEVMDNCLSTGRVHVERTQVGMIRFSYATGKIIEGPPKQYSEHPPRLRCQPELAPDDGDPVALTTADFESLEYGDPGYCQLRRSAPVAVRMGADDGGEMGVFHDQFTPHRERALWRRLEEFTPATHTLSVLYAN